MSAALARAVLGMAVACLPHRRRDWALAMEGEFEAALAGGDGLSFSAGCLIAGWRELPGHGEGRRLLGGYAIALGLLVPMAALLLWVALVGLPIPGLAHGAVVNDGNRAVVPVLSQLVVAIAALRLTVAWAVLDRDWARVAVMQRLSAACVIALAVLTGLALLDASCLLLPVVTLVAEALVTSALARLGDDSLADLDGA